MFCSIGRRRGTWARLPVTPSNDSQMCNGFIGYRSYLHNTEELEDSSAIHDAAESAAGQFIR